MEYKPEANMDVIERLPHSLLEVLEQAANRVHDMWAAGRIEEGWSWGEFLDEKKKTHPCLIPYEQLKDHDKDYDRRTAAITIQCLLDRGIIEADKKGK